MSLIRGTPRRRGSVLIFVIAVSTILWFALGATMVFTWDARKSMAQRAEHDQSLMVAESGVGQALAWLEVQGSPPVSNTDLTAAAAIDNPASADYDLQVDVYPQADGAKQYWTVVSTASYKGTKVANREFHRRVQTTVEQENFAKFEYFVDYGPTWSPGYLHFYGFNRVYFGPMHSNSGVGLWPNLWFIDEFSSSVPGNPPVREYANYSSYVSGVYYKADANNYVNIMKYYNSTYKHEPKFYKGLRIRDEAINFPEDLSVDPRADMLRTNAGLRLPADYSDYDSSKGSKFVIKLEDPTTAPGDGIIKIKQFLGKNASNEPLFGPEITRTIGGINGAMIVTGDVVSLEGVVDGRLTIGAFAGNGGTGKVQVTDSVEYQSRLEDDDFVYSDAPDLFTPDGADVNQGFVDNLKTQVYALDDILGIVSEHDVTIPERDLHGNTIGVGYENPLFLDMIVLATGQGTASSTDGSYYPENMLNRPIGRAHRFGGVIQYRAGSWALFSGGNHAAGLHGPSLWDFRAVQSNGAPPFFPTTGQYEYSPQTWRETFLNAKTDSPWLPVEVAGP